MGIALGIGCGPDEHPHDLASTYERGNASTGDARAVAQPMEIDVVIETVEGWNARGDDWHFHRLHPTCFLNQNQAIWAIFLENTSTNSFYLVETDQPDTGVKDVLFKLFELASMRTPRMPGMRP